MHGVFFLFLLKTEKEGVVKHFSVSVDKAGERSAQDLQIPRDVEIFSLQGLFLRVFPLLHSTDTRLCSSLERAEERMNAHLGGFVSCRQLFFLFWLGGDARTASTSAFAAVISDLLTSGRPVFTPNGFCQ